MKLTGTSLITLLIQSALNFMPACTEAFSPSSTTAFFNDAADLYLSPGAVLDLAFGATDVIDPTSSDVYEFTDKTQLEAHIGNLSIGGVLAESGATGVETTNADGSVNGSFVAHFNDAGVAVTTHTEPGGEPEPTRYSLLLENVSDGRGLDSHVWGKALAPVITFD